MIRLAQIRTSLLHLFFPHCCAGCGSDLLPVSSQLCLRCLHELPSTGFGQWKDNPAEKLFYGRLRAAAVTAGYFFHKDSLMQSIMHEIKYKGNQKLALQMGRLLGLQIKDNVRFLADGLIPLPLFPKKQKQRGYNQAELLCNGMSETLGIPVWNRSVIRTMHTETQTRKGRIERWQNMEGKFQVIAPELLKEKRVLLVDDVITTGATLESCGEALLNAGCMLSIVTLCIAVK